MSKWKDFEFCAAGWDKKRWDLRYTGENKDLVIPEKNDRESRRKGNHCHFCRQWE